MTNTAIRRPRVKRTCLLQVRVTAQELTALQIVADAAGYTVSEFVRRAILPQSL